MHAPADEACAEGDGDCVADAVALRETVALVVALAVGDGEPVFVGEPVDEGVEDSEGVVLAESEEVGVLVGVGDGDVAAVGGTHPLICGAHIAVLVPAPLTLEKGVLATTAPDASSSSSVKPKLAPRVKPSTATLVTTALAAKVTCRKGDGSQGQ